MFYLFDVCALDNGSKGIGQLCQDRLCGFRTGQAGDISIANGVGGEDDIVTEIGAGPGRGRDADVGHVAGHDGLLTSVAQGGQIVMQVGVGEARDFLFGNHLFACARLELVEFLRQRRPRREHGRSLGRLVHNVHNVLAVPRGPVFLQQRRDGLARVFHVDRFQRPHRISKVDSWLTLALLVCILGLEPPRLGVLLDCAYSFCASMMISVESFGDAVDGGAPRRSRNDLTCVADAILVSMVCLFVCLMWWCGWGW